MKSSSLSWLGILLLTCISKTLSEKERVLNGSALTTCRRPKAPKNAVISYLTAPRRYPEDDTGHDYGVDEYVEHDNVYFHCREGFSQTSHSTMYITCGSNGKWFPDVKNLGKCVKNTHFNKCTHGLFRCKTSEKCISQRKRCDCTVDCDDGSDEIGCTRRRKIIRAPAKGRDSSGIITNPGYPRKPPSNFSCDYHISTYANNHIQVSFEEFDLPDMKDSKCLDFIRIVGLHPKSVTTNKNKRRRYKNKILTETKCGQRKFQRVFSSHMHVTVTVSLTHEMQKHRGFAFTWKIVNHDVIENYQPMDIHPVNTKQEKDTEEENIYTILTPIAISALVPLSLVTFLCCHKHLRHRCGCKSKSHSSDKNSEDGITEPGAKTLMLTENNLALFEQQHQKRLKDDESREHHTESDEYSRKNVIESAPACDCRCCLANSRNGHHPDVIGDKLQRGSYNSSQQSEIPRYVMSYDVPARHSPVANLGQERSSYLSNRSSCATPDQVVSSSSRLKIPYGSSPHLNHSLPLRGRQSRCSRDNLGHSYSTQSSNSCRLCNQTKSMRKFENYYKHRTHIDDSHIEEDAQPIDDSYQEYSHPVKECSKNFYPSGEDFHEYQQNRTNHTSFHDFCNNTTVKLSSKNSLEAYGSDYYRVKHALHSNDSLSSCYAENHPYQQTRVMYIEKTYGHERFPASVCSKRSEEIYLPRSFDSSTDRALGGSLICTH